MQLSDDTCAIRHVKQALLLPALGRDLIAIWTHFKQVADMITRLEEQGMRLSFVIDLITSLQHSLDLGGAAQ